MGCQKVRSQTPAGPLPAPISCTAQSSALPAACKSLNSVSVRCSCIATRATRQPVIGYSLTSSQRRSTRDIPLPAAVMQYLEGYVAQFLPLKLKTSSPTRHCSGQPTGSGARAVCAASMEGRNIWRLCKTQIGYPMLKPHDLRHGVAVEVYEQHHDLEEVRGLLRRKSIETTQLYAQIRPAGLKHDVNFYEAKALDGLSS